MRASLKDIAKKVGVSVSTVSYALNGGPKPVAAELRERIRAVATELDYRPNQLARSMKSKRSKIVGVAHTNIRHHLLTWPLVGTAVSGVADAAIDHGYDVLLYTHTTQLDGEELLNYLLDGRADGLILMAPEHAGELVELLSGRRFPVVVIADRPRGSLPHLVLDNFGAVRMLLELLASKGHRRVGHLVGRRSLFDATQRLEAFLDLVPELGMETRPAWVADTDFGEESGYRAALAVLRELERPTALLCGNDATAMGAVRAAMELGLRVPEDLSVTGIDDWVEARACPIPLTTVRFDHEGMGQAAFRAVMAMLDGVDVAEVQIFDGRLIERASVSYPTEDI